MATKTNGGIMKRARTSVKSVVDVKKQNINGSMPRFSYTFIVKSVSHPAAKVIKKRAIPSKVLVSKFFIQNVYIKTPIVRKI